MEAPPRPPKIRHRPLDTFTGNPYTGVVRFLEIHAGLFWELLRTPFLHPEMIWGIVPLYFGWLLNEITANKASFQTAIQTGFSFLWAGAHWIWQASDGRLSTWRDWWSVNTLVTLGVMGIGVVSLVAGLMRRFPPGGRFLGHTRFGNYFMIAMFPIQSGALAWTWPRAACMVLFAIPAWLLLHFGLSPWRRR